MKILFAMVCAILLLFGISYAIGFAKGLWKGTIGLWIYIWKNRERFDQMAETIGSKEATMIICDEYVKSLNLE